jgi:hypothetical protein
MVDFVVDPRKLALINGELQNAFIEGTPVSAPDGPAVVARVNKLASGPGTCQSLQIGVSVLKFTDMNVAE